MFFRTLACLPALVGAWRDRGGGLARSVGSWQDALVDEDALARPDLLAGRDAARAQHEPARRDPAPTPTLDPPVKAMIVWNSNPLVIVPNAELIRRGHGPRRPVHRGARAVPHRHGAATPTSCCRPRRRSRPTDVVTVVGPPVDGLERGRHRAARRGRAATASCFRRLAGAMGLTEPALFDDDMTRAARRAADGRPRRAAARRLDARCRTPRTAARGATAGSRPRRARSSSSASGCAAMGQPALPTFVAAARGPARRRRPARALPAAAADAQAPHPVPELRLLAAAQARPAPRVVRSSSSTPPTPRAGASPTATCARVCNDRASARASRCGSPTGCGPASSPIPFGWWRAHHPDGKVANCSPTTRSPTGAAASRSATRSSQSPRA